MSAANRAQSVRPTRLYASLRLSLSVSGASGPPTSAFLINGRAVRSICSPSLGIGGVLSTVLFVRDGSACGALCTALHTARSLPPAVTTSRSIEITSEEDFQPERKFVAGPPSVCRQVSRIERDVGSSNCGQSTPSTWVPRWIAVPTTPYIALVPFTLLKKGSSRKPANTRKR